MTTPYQIIALVLTAIGIILSFYTIVNRQNTAFREEINKRFEVLNTKVEEVDKNTAVGFQKVSGQFELMTLQVNRILESDIIEIRSRLNKLESGQDDWTKELRERTHNIAGQVDKQGYEIELLKVKCSKLA